MIKREKSEVEKVPSEPPLTVEEVIVDWTGGSPVWGRLPTRTVKPMYGSFRDPYREENSR